ncbi:MAG TPA: DUF2461 domain-containing protein [Gemmatimonadaceae bacterium]|nr:DUF2461 domain-containing protein [Gemmatimonadaceae bacterium]
MNEFMGFRPAAFVFLRGLAKNNRREWFEARRETYEGEVRGPMRALVDELDAVCGKVAPELRGDAKKSVFRIHRDVRFSNDKSPYKTNAACWLFHDDAGHGVGREAHGGAGFYFQIEPGNCFVGGGVWMPPKPALDRIRTAIDEDLPAFERVVTDSRLKQRFGALDDEAVLPRVPRGYAPEHPGAKWLRYKSYIVGRKIPDASAKSRRLIATLTTDIQTVLPLVRWLNSALGLRTIKSR